MNAYTFNINGVNYLIVNQWIKTRNGFKHESSLLTQTDNFNEKEYYTERLTTKFNYTNRTWESFQYESIMKKLIGEYFQSIDDIKLIYKQLGIESL
jgi:predicted 3-demethylubiquinone-9 3-methyltransferase (glyoxalase superfamily)